MGHVEEAGLASAVRERGDAVPQRDGVADGDRDRRERRRRSSKRCSTARVSSSRSRRSGRSRRAAASRTSRSSSASRASTTAQFGQRARSARSAGFLQEISLYSDQDALRNDEDGDGGQVTLMTLHNAKGLEFRAVFMIGVEEGIFPHARSIEENSLEEERRLCLRRHDAREGAADADARDAPQPLRTQRREPAVALPRRAADGRAWSASGCSRRRGRATAPRAPQEVRDAREHPGALDRRHGAPRSRWAPGS